MPKRRHWAAGLPPTHSPRGRLSQCPGDPGVREILERPQEVASLTVHTACRAGPQGQVQTPPGRSEDEAVVPLSLQAQVQAFTGSSGLPSSPQSSILLTQQTPSELGLP